MPTVMEEDDDDDELMQVCSRLIHSAADQAKGFHTFLRHLLNSTQLKFDKNGSLRG